MLTYFCYTGKILVFLINFVIQGDFLVILTLNKRKYLKFCHTERSEVSIQKNGEWIAEFMDFSLRLKWQCELSLRALRKQSVAIHKFKVYLKFFGFFCCGYALQPVGSLTLKMTRFFKNSNKFHKKTKSPPPSLYFQCFEALFCFILGVVLKKIANFFRKRHFLCYNFICL